mgnify:CR=1 FL=1
MGDEGLETNSATHISSNTLGQMTITTDAESDAIPLACKPECDRFAESLVMIAGLPLSDADKTEAIKLLLSNARQLDIEERQKAMGIC